ncbi:MAG: hypothetical protein D8M59_14615 [Planctomycetes bacterium]|nr:hypothetical protein [Planctomycetota bacterium]
MRWRKREAWKALQELAELDHDQFQFLRRQTLKQLDIRIAVGFITLIVTVVLTFGVFLLLAVFGSWLFPNGCHSLRHIALRPQGPIALVLGTVLPALLIARLHDWMILGFMRVHVRDNMARAVCAACRHSLVSQSPVEGCITCPECGTAIALEGLGITEDEWARIAAPRHDAGDA